MPFGNTVAGPVLTTDILATGVIVVVAVLVLFPGVGSVVLAGGVTVATLVIVLPVPAVPVTVKVTLPPLGKVGILNVPPCKEDTVGEAGHTAPPVTLPQLTPDTVKFATPGSLTVVPLAALGPALLITNV